MICRYAYCLGFKIGPLLKELCSFFESTQNLSPQLLLQFSSYSFQQVVFVWYESVHIMWYFGFDLYRESYVPYRVWEGFFWYNFSAAPSAVFKYWIRFMAFMSYFNCLQITIHSFLDRSLCGSIRVHCTHFWFVLCIMYYSNTLCTQHRFFSHIFIKLCMLFCQGLKINISVCKFPASIFPPVTVWTLPD